MRLVGGPVGVVSHGYIPLQTGSEAVDEIPLQVRV